MFVCVFVCLSVNFFSVKDFSATTWTRALKFGTKLDSDNLYRVTRLQPHIAYQSFFCSFFFLSKGNFNFFSVKDFSATIGASVLKFCVHLQVGKVYCVNGKWDANPHFTFFFQFFISSFFHSYIIHKDIFSVRYLSNYLI